MISSRAFLRASPLRPLFGKQGRKKPKKNRWARNRIRRARSPQVLTRLPRDYQILKTAFVHRQNTEFYLQTRSTADKEDEILALLRDYERLLVDSEDPVPSASEFVDRARALIEKGYDHPLIHYVYGAFLRQLMTRSSLRESQRETELC